MTQAESQLAITATGSMQRLVFAIFLVSLCVGGCSSRPKDFPTLAPVSGTVTMNGQPLQNVMVTFTSGKGIVALGPTDPAGCYELRSRGITPGAGLGSNNVTIRSIPENPDVGLLSEPIPARYNSNSTLTVDVAVAKNTFDFDLKAEPAKRK